MRKIITLFAALALVFSLFAGCATVKPQASVSAGAPSEEPANASAAASEEPDVSAEPSSDVSTPAGTPSDPTSSYAAYTSMKGAAYERLDKKMQANEDLYMTVGMSLFTVGVVDLALIPLTVVSAGEGSEAALEMLGMTGVDITQNGNDYTVTYTDPENGSVTMACKYDPATDSMQSTVSGSEGKEQMFFEYVRAGNGYASQYYMDNGDGTFTKVTSFFNDKDIAAFGVASAEAKPDSILGNSSLTKDFVVNDEMYFILEGDSLTVLENGEPKTY